MKKLLGIVVLGFLLTTNVYANSAKIFIENTDIDIVKSKLIDHHLEQGWDIYEETNNKISFSKKLEGFEGALVMTLLKGDSYPYARTIFTLSKKDNGINIYTSAEYYNSVEIHKLTEKKNIEQYQKFLNEFKEKF